MACPRVRAGTSLLEVIVVIAVLGVMAAVVGLSWRPGRPAREDPFSAEADVAAARRQALATGASVTVHVDVDGAARTVTALPDGRIIGAEPLGFDGLSGRRSDSLDERLDGDSRPPPGLPPLEGGEARPSSARLRAAAQPISSGRTGRTPR